LDTNLQPASPQGDPAGDADAMLLLEAAIEEACTLVPPLWTLRNFVAVNPYLGLTNRSVREAAGALCRVYHARTFLPTSFYRERHAEGRIADVDLEIALAEAPRALGRPLSRTELTALRWGLFDETLEDGDARVLTVAEAVDREDGSQWARRVTDEIAKWCAGRFDRGQAAWPQPWLDRPVFAAWREMAAIDRSAELWGLRGFRAYVRELPEKPVDAVARVLEQLGVTPGAATELLARELASIAGWAGHLQYRAREASFAGRQDTSLHDLLAIRLAFDGAIDHALQGRGARLLARRRDAPPAPPPRVSRVDAALTWQLAYEAGFRRRLLHALDGPPTPAAPEIRLQAVFCIDVRSERLRRQLEHVSDSIQTLGFAGFFGFPVETIAPGEERGEARCPVLIRAPYRIPRPGSTDAIAATRRARARARHRLFAKLRKLSVGAFSLAETVGYAFGVRLVTDSLTWTSPQPDGGLFEKPRVGGRLPRVTPKPDAPDLDIPLEQQCDLAEGALRNMSLTDGFAEIVLLCGHGARTTNNPYASSLDCGACGGHAGDESARVAARVLNTPAVRAGLARRGIRVPEETRFVAALHDTTADSVTLLDAEELPEATRRRLAAWLDAACERTAAERSRRLGGEPLEGLRRRARDWSEVRPEWGLAGNAAFIAAPRSWTRGVDLDGRVFLHEYDPEADPEGRVLELILTAPLVVASWINLQYYASSVDPEVFGSGSKVLHNVVGRHGVMTGNRSDLRVGLPWESIHDGRGYVHEPMRLLAIVQAPTERIDAVLDAHPQVGELVENGWVHLVAWDRETKAFLRRGAGSGAWEPLLLSAEAG